jgi:hypothetical protein
MKFIPDQCNDLAFWAALQMPPSRGSKAFILNQTTSNQNYLTSKNKKTILSEFENGYNEFDTFVDVFYEQKK